jgi:aquaporin Z
MVTEKKTATHGTGRGHPELSDAERNSVRQFNNIYFEWRRLFAELFGTFLLVLTAAGGGLVDAISGGAVGRVATVSAPGLMVFAIILFMGAVSGAHLNPVVSIAFALRGDFQWRRVPGYFLAQTAGAVLAAAVLHGILGFRGDNGATVPGQGFTDLQCLALEILLTLGLVSTILGGASGAQIVGTLSAFAVGAYIILAGLWAGPVSGASMNPARTLGPDLLRGDVTHTWIYVAGPLVGASLAVGIAYILRGPGGGPAGRKAAQGTLP